MSSSEEVPLDFGIGVARRLHFSWLDLLRRSHGDLLGNLGINPKEQPYRVVDSGMFWSLRHYSSGTGIPLMIVPAPIKRPYIWDIIPSVSIVLLLLSEGYDVYLIEWRSATPQTSSFGLEEYAGAIRECVDFVSSGGVSPLLIGHSLGGTIAAIYAACASASISRLVLLGSPLSFSPGCSAFRDALVRLAPPELADEAPVPGSLLSSASAAASPESFVWSRLMHAALSRDPHALYLHAFVERWALDEVALSGRLTHQIVEGLYHNNRFQEGTLRLGREAVGPSQINIPVLAVVNSLDEVAPPSTVIPFLSAMRDRGQQMISFSGEPAIGLQHLAILVGERTRLEVWPGILAWMAGGNTAPGRNATAGHNASQEKEACNTRPPRCVAPGKIPDEDEGTSAPPAYQADEQYSA
jgi:poly[(R)-3-hydroxyalkanoate] polymerase subunit PhaC